MPRGYVDMVGDLFHIGHLRQIQQAQQLGYEVVVGVHSDEDVASYKRLPIMTMSERVTIVSEMPNVLKVIPSAPLRITQEFIEEHKIDMVFHGHEAEEDYLYDHMYGIPKSIGKFTRTARTPEISTTALIERVVSRESSAAWSRVSTLRDLLNTRGKHRALRIMEAHNGLSGLVVEHASAGGKSFDGMWSSSLTASVSKGKPDIEVVDTTARLQLVRDTMEVTGKPMVYDGDTGGAPEILAFTVRSLEDLGVSACIIEDKTGLKQNSLFGTDAVQVLENIDMFCAKIKAAAAARSNRKFMVIARIEALIAGLGEKEALKRAKAYIVAGADAIMIHSKESTFDEVRSFLRAYAKFSIKVPVVAVPTSYFHVTEKELFDEGVSICIYANHMLRASYPSMTTVAESILHHGTAAACHPSLMSVKKIITLLPNAGADSVRIPLTPEEPTLDDSLGVDSSNLLSQLIEKGGLRCVIGVPNSVLKPFCDAVVNVEGDVRHVITSNEGAAIATAGGWYLATGDAPLVYMQNSGLGNAMNPLVSAAHRETFGFPMVILIGWRGEPGVKDEEQHKVQGRHTIAMLGASDIEFSTLPDNTAAAAQMITRARASALKQSQPVAVLVRPTALRWPPSVKPVSVQNSSLPSRWEVLEALVDTVFTDDDFVVCTTGYASRELYTIRRDRGLPIDCNLLMVGSMGHALAIAQGVALGQPSRKVWCIDGDGASIMHMGTMASSAALVRVPPCVVDSPPQARGVAELADSLLDDSSFTF